MGKDKNTKLFDANNSLINLFLMGNKPDRALKWLKEAESFGNEINTKLKQTTLKKYSQMIVSAYSNQEYIDAYRFLKDAQGYSLSIDPLTVKIIVKAPGYISEASPEARAITLTILKCFHEYKYQQAWGQIRKAEAQKMKICSELKKIIEKKILPAPF